MPLRARPTFSIMPDENRQTDCLTEIDWKKRRMRVCAARLSEFRGDDTHTSIKKTNTFRLPIKLVAASVSYSSGFGLDKGRWRFNKCLAPLYATGKCIFASRRA